MLRASSHKNASAIADGASVIEMTNAPGMLRAIALYNRALVYCDIFQDSNAVSDVNLVLQMSHATRYVRTETRRKLLRLKRTSNRTDALKSNVASRSKGGLFARTEPAAASKHSDSDDIVVTAVAVRGKAVRIRIEAPKRVHVVRSELKNHVLDVPWFVPGEKSSPSRETRDSGGLSVWEIEGGAGNNSAAVNSRPDIEQDFVAKAVAP